MALLAGERTFEERVFDLLDVAEYRAMESHEDREAAFRLRHDAYLRSGYIDEDPDGISTDFLDEKPNTKTFGLFIAKKLVASVRVSVLTNECQFAPSTIYNLETLKPGLDAGKVYIDPSRFVTDAVAAREFPELPYLTIRIPAMACEHYEADECLASVRLTHQAFYRRVFRSQPIADPIEYKMLNMTIQLMSTTVQVIRDDVARRYPFFRSTYLERRALFGPSILMPGIEQERVAIAA